MIDLGMLVLRIGLGVMFVMHGLQKTFGAFGGPGIKGFSEFLKSLGFVPAIFWSYVAGYTELIAGTFLILGLFPRVSSSLLFILIAVAALKVHIKNGFLLASGGFEYTFIIACICFVLVIIGAGRFSLYNKF